MLVVLTAVTMHLQLVYSIYLGAMFEQEGISH